MDWLLDWGYGGLFVGAMLAATIIPFSSDVLLTRSEDIYTGLYPADLIVANTAFRWSGVDWALINLSSLLPLDRADRISLLAHESFHVVQPALGFKAYNAENPHLDGMRGRILFKLELEALKKALAAAGDGERNDHLTAAFLFRAHRRALFPGSDSTENLLELNEGLAEYTGEASGGRPVQEKTAHFTTMIDRAYRMPSFVRSFAYQTTPAYGYLLDRSRPGWNRQITGDTDLTAFFIRAFGLDIPTATQQEVERRATAYNGEAITVEERQREEKRRERMAAYKETFVDSPHFDIALQERQIGFNPQNLLPLEGYGTVYPTLYVKDNWGVLNVSEGALLSPGWDRVTLSLPQSQEGNIITGEGWRLELAEGYTVTTDSQTGNASLIRQ